jgi:hypothetical protein
MGRKDTGCFQPVMANSPLFLSIVTFPVAFRHVANDEPLVLLKNKIQKP